MVIKHMRRYSTSLIIRQMSIKMTSLSSEWLLPERGGKWHVGEEILKCLCAVGGNIKWWVAMENSMVVPQKTKIELSDDSPIPFLDIYPK